MVLADQQQRKNTKGKRHTTTAAAAAKLFIEKSHYAQQEFRIYTFTQIHIFFLVDFSHSFSASLGCVQSGRESFYFCNSAFVCGSLKIFTSSHFFFGCNQRQWRSASLRVQYRMHSHSWRCTFFWFSDIFATALVSFATASTENLWFDGPRSGLRLFKCLVQSHGRRTSPIRGLQSAAKRRVFRDENPADGGWRKWSYHKLIQFNAREFRARAPERSQQMPRLRAEINMHIHFQLWSSMAMWVTHLGMPSEYILYGTANEDSKNCIYIMDSVPIKVSIDFCSVCGKESLENCTSPTAAGIDYKVCGMHIDMCSPWMKVSPNMQIESVTSCSLSSCPAAHAIFHTMHFA